MRLSFRLSVLVAIWLGALSTISFAAPGDLDKSFGTQGKVITDFYDGTDVGSNLLLTPDGQILIGGAATKVSVSDHFALARYHADGSLDQNFGTGGKQATRRISESKIVNDGITGFGRLSDGRIIACGQGFQNGNQGLALLSYLPNGQLDTSFGGDGAVITLDVSQTFPLALTIDQQDRIVVVASTFYQYPESAAMVVFRFFANGEIDGAFGIDGKVIKKLTRGIDVPRAVQVDDDGKVVVGGFNGNNKFVVLRFKDDGMIDESFGNLGVATIEFNSGGIDTLHALALQRDGKIVLGGDVQVGSFGGLRMVDFGLARLTNDGVLDTTFNKTGKQITYFVQPAASTLWALKVQDDGKIVALGDASLVKGLALARYNIDGSLDETFGEKGKQIMLCGNTCHWEGVALQSNGKIVAGGYIWNGKHYDIALARFEN